jgi:hypothetical protein
MGAIRGDVIVTEKNIGGCRDDANECGVLRGGLDAERGGLGDGRDWLGDVRNGLGDVCVGLGDVCVGLHSGLLDEMKEFQSIRRI